MRTNLVETYRKQLNIAEAYVAKNYDGKSVNGNTKLTTAVLLDNTNRWITESMNSVATERSDLGAWKKFCLNLTNLAVPSLIANDLVIVHPMTSYSGSVAYLKYVSLTDKGDVKKGTEFNSVFALGQMTDARRDFTAQASIETIAEGSGTPAVTLTPMHVTAGVCCDEWGGRGFYNKADGKYYDAKIVRNGQAIFTNVADGEFETELQVGDKVAYFSEEFQMEHVPAQDIPTIGPKMEHIPLVAEPRRIAVKYDQITAYQAKTDYGFSLDKQIAEQACGELAYEIDTEIVDMLREGAGEALPELTWSKVKPVGISIYEHYNSFLEIIEMARAIIYKRTQKFQPNYMVVAANVLPVLKFVNGFSGAKVNKMNGPYKAGTLDSLDVYVSPRMDDGEFFIGLNGSDMMSSAGVYAPYMAIVPTQLLGLPDGGLTQGFSTWYAKALLNKSLLVAGKITDTPATAEAIYGVINGQF